MPDSHVWEEDEVELKVSASLARYQGEEATFIFKTDDSQAVRLGDAKVRIGDTTNKGLWKPTPKPTSVLGSSFSDLFYRAKYEVIVKNETKTHFVDKVWVCAKKIEVTAFKAGKPTEKFPKAKCKLTQTPPPDKGSTAYEVTREADGEGKIDFDLKYPQPDVKLEWQRPWHGKWKPDKDKGAKREALVAYGAKCTIRSPVKPPDKKPHIQYVNLAPTNGHPERGRTLTIEVVPVTPAEAEVGQLVFLKAEFHKDNSTRVGAAAAAAQTWEDAQPYNGQKVAVFQIDLGVAGGDQVEIKVGGIGKKKDEADPTAPEFVMDDSMKVETRRKIFYELAYPKDMGRLGQTKVNGANVSDKPTAMKEWETKELAKAGIELECTKSADFTPPSHMKFAASYVVKGAKGDVVIFGNHNYHLSGATFNAAEQRTTHITLVDHYYAGYNGASAFGPIALKKIETDVPVPAGLLCFKVSFAYLTDGGGNDCIEGNILWQADVDPVKYPNHPGVRDINGVKTKRFEALPRGCLTHPDGRTIRVTLPTANPQDPGNIVSSLVTSTKCPIKLWFSAFLAFPINGSAAGGSITLVMSRPLLPNASTFCHELGHLMGLTVINQGTWAAEPPEGMAVPPDTANSGDMYLHTHVGNHCAHGVADAQKNVVDFGGQIGDCIMFGIGTNKVPPEQKEYCATCLKYLKARNLEDIRSKWTGRADATKY
jgi:hypothetical protein